MGPAIHLGACLQKGFVMHDRKIVLTDEQIKLVAGGGWCEAGFMAVGGILGAGVGGYFSGGLAAAGGFSLGVTLGQDLGQMICSK